MNFTYFLFSFLFLQTSSFSINRRSALASMIGMTALNPEESNNDNPQKQLKIAPQNNPLVHVQRASQTIPPNLPQTVPMPPKKTSQNFKNENPKQLRRRCTSTRYFS